jgi:hypothetical protein
LMKMTWIRSRETGKEYIFRVRKMSARQVTHPLNILFLYSIPSKIAKVKGGLHESLACD